LKERRNEKGNADLHRQSLRRNSTLRPAYRQAPARTARQAKEGGEVIVHTSPDGEVRVDVRMERETAWLSFKQIAELFQRDKSVISRHLQKVFASGELERAATVAENATVPVEDGHKVTRRIEYFTSTRSSRSGTASTQSAGRSSASGPPARSASTSCAATRSMSDGCARRGWRPSACPTSRG
jgi:hypothetical protein